MQSVKAEQPELPAADSADSADSAATAAEPAAAEAAAPAEPAASTEVADGPADGPFGPGSAMPEDDGSGPAGWIKGNADTMLFHTADSPHYERTEAEVYFKDEQTATAAGFRHWDASKR